MQSVRSILVVLQPEHAQGWSLDRATLIARVTGARLHLFVHDKHSDHRSRLALLSRQLDEQGYENVTSQQSSTGTLPEAIIQAQQAYGCDLVIKEHHPDQPLVKALLTPEDWKLLRLCPCAVLMVKSGKPWAGGVVLAAVDIGNDDEDHRALHASIIDTGYDASTLIRGQLHVVSAHPSPTLPGPDPAYQVSTDHLEHYADACRTFQRVHDISDERMHMAAGAADAVIPAVEQAHAAVLTIVGTIGRTGLAGALIGNTAEVVLDALQCDVLVLKSEEAAAHLARLSKS